MISGNKNNGEIGDTAETTNSDDDSIGDDTQKDACQEVVHLANSKINVKTGHTADSCNDVNDTVGYGANNCDHECPSDSNNASNNNMDNNNMEEENDIKGGNFICSYCSLISLFIWLYH